MAQIHCTRCSYDGPDKKFTPGYFLLEFFLWLLVILPGLIYSIWRLSARYRGCPICRAKETVPLDYWRQTHAAPSV